MLLSVERGEPSVIAAILMGLALTGPATDRATRTVSDASAALVAGRTSSTALVRGYRTRIAATDRTGPMLRAVIALNPDALAQARAADARRRAGHPLSPLDGVPILVKDNIETLDPMATTAGSLALIGNISHRDAPIIARLRARGMVILGKTNLSEWANIRSTRSMSGWSAVGGLVRNPYALDRTACGSSSGSGAAVAAGYAPVALGTETDGSIVCPSSINGLVGMKPTVGLLSRSRIVPISHSQDTPGPMATTVRDAAMLLSALAGSDPADAATADADAHAHDFAAGLSVDALRGQRMAVYRPEMTPALAERFDAALAALRQAGAVLVPVEAPKLDGLGEAELLVLQTELKADLDTYLASTPPSVATRSLAQVIAFDDAHAAQEMPFFGQETFLAAEQTHGLDDPKYKAARALCLRLARAQGIEAMLKAAGAKVLVTPTYGPAWLSDPVYGDQYGGPSAATLPAVAGYPDLTVPMGLVQGLPAGLSFIATMWGDQTVLDAGYAYEQASHARIEPRLLATADVGPGLDATR